MLCELVSAILSFSWSSPSGARLGSLIVSYLEHPSSWKLVRSDGPTRVLFAPGLEGFNFTNRSFPIEPFPVGLNETE